MWSADTELYLDDTDSITIIDKETGHEKERLYVGREESVIQVFGMVESNIYFNVVRGGVYAFNIDTRKYSSPIVDNYPASILIKAVYKVYDEENDKYILKLLDLNDGTTVDLVTTTGIEEAFQKEIAGTEVLLYES